MNKTLTEIINSRKSIRAFLDKPVDNKVIEEMLKKASQGTIRRQPAAMENLCD
jgi:nitroreductase